RGTAAVRDDGPAGGAGRREPAGQPLLSPHPSHRGGGPRRAGGHVSFDLDPVWPWARLYDMLTQVPPSVRAIALFAALPAAAVPRVRWLAWTLVAAGAVSVVFVARYLWAPAMDDAVAAVGPGVRGSFTGVSWLHGLILLLLVPPVLGGLSVAAYVGTRGVSRRKIAAAHPPRPLALPPVPTAPAPPALTSR